MDVFNALVLLSIQLCILLEAAGGALSSNLKHQLSNCYAGRLAQRSLACYWRGLRPHYLSQSYYYLCVVPGLPPVICRCPYNLVFEESVQTCVPGYIKGANSAALLHSYRTKWSNTYGHRQIINNNGLAHNGDPYENHVAVRPWAEGRKRHKRATVNDDIDDRSLSTNPRNIRHHRDPSSHRLASNNDHLEVQLHQLSAPHPDSKKTLFEDTKVNDEDINTVSGFQGSTNEKGYVAEPAERVSEDLSGPPEQEPEQDMFPVWAIALASLCFVILLILIVMYLY